MVLSNIRGSELTRIRVSLLVIVAAFVFLGTVLWRVQVLNAAKYSRSLDRQSIRRVRLPGIRGRIFDRNGVCLADNRPSYCIAIYIEELRQPGRWQNTINEVERVITYLSDVLGIKRQVTAEDIKRHIKKRLPLPFLAWRDITYAVLARWAESNMECPGVDVYVEPLRVYPHGSLAAHVLGYVGRATPEPDANEPYRTFYLPEMEGKRGIEAVMNEDLAGIPGGQLIRVDASGFKYEKIGERESYPGEDITLTLDMRIQRLAEQVMHGEKGAVVILDPRNGDVLSLVSSPSFDLNSFTPRMSRAEWERLISNKGKPFFNRAVSGAYLPGSTFKPLVVIAALESGRVTEQTRFNCPGYFELGGVRFHCWNKRGHGALNMRKAISQSCNAYFCQLGLRCGYRRIFHMAEAVGFGRKTGIDLKFESGGLLPNNVWKIRNRNTAWCGGDTCNVAIGQGLLLTTPLQMAVFTAAIANGGYVYRPRLVMNSEFRNQNSEFRKRDLVVKMAWSANTLEVIRGGMYDVIQAHDGTGKNARIMQVAMAGKTGTAEYGKKDNPKKYAWMILFAPFDSPRYAVVMVIEDAVSGGVTAAPRVKKLMEGIFEEVAAYVPQSRDYGVPRREGE